MATVASQTNAAKRQTQPRTDKRNPKACHEALTRFAKKTYGHDQQDSSSQAVTQNEHDSNVTPVESLQSYTKQTNRRDQTKPSDQRPSTEGLRVTAQESHKKEDCHEQEGGHEKADDNEESEQ
ncbi:hypothetical protein MMC22_004313 [Lobaria immixta]|nr:hypothetical protein [Lobaria immixta]